jgi:hypothetical protein
MTKHELASFTLKLLGIYALIESLPFLQPLAGLASLPSDTPDASMYRWTLVGELVVFALMVLVGVLLFVYSRELAPRLVGEDQPLNVSSTLTARDVQAIGFSIVGALIFLQALPGLSQAVWGWLYLIAQSSRQDYRGPVPRVTGAFGLTAAIQLVLAVVLFLQARGLANLWHRIQSGRYVKIVDRGRDETSKQDGQ